MVLIVVLSVTILGLTTGHPTEDPKIPQVNISNPYEINNLNYYSGNTDSEPEESKVFRRTVSNFEKSVNYLDQTVKEVETLINGNSTLPRLTRGEILTIIENITKHDLQDELKKKNKTREEKAVMLVMPYTPDNDDDSKMQELFTKPPVTRLVGEPPKINEIPKSKRKRPPAYVPQGGFYGEVFVEPTPVETSPKPTKYHRAPVYTQTPLIETTSTTQKPTTPKFVSSTRNALPEIVTFKSFYAEPSTERLKHRRRSTTTTTTSTTQPPTPKISTEVSVKTHTETNFSLRKRRPQKTPTRFSNHKYPDDEYSANHGLKLVEPPKLGQTPELFTAPPELTTKKVERFTFATAYPAKPSRPHHFTPPQPLLANVNLPEDLKSTLDELNLSDSLSQVPVKYDNPQNLPKPPPLNDDVRDLLASIGVLPSTSTTTPIPNISNVADTLTPEMKELLMSFGLIPDPNPKPPKSTKEEQPIADSTSAEISPESYVQFKPLPENGPTRDEMEEFLGRFGLGRNTKNNREAKTIKVFEKPEKILSEVPRIEPEMLPETMKSVLADLGLVDRNGKKIRAEALQQHVFNPKHSSHANQEDLDKLNQLLDIIKQLEKLNGTVTEDKLSKTELKNIKDLVGSLNKDAFVPLDQQQWGPNPLHYDFGLNKNEVKRQENSSSSSSSSSTEAIITVTPSASSTTSVSSSTTTTVTSQTPNLKDLEDSFGGESAPSSPAASLPPPTEAPQTGFYYLLDWNSFLEVDNQMGKRVNLRFQPKAGDPKRFYSVSVP